MHTPSPRSRWNISIISVVIPVGLIVAAFIAMVAVDRLSAGYRAFWVVFLFGLGTGLGLAIAALVRGHASKLPAVVGVVLNTAVFLLVLLSSLRDRATLTLPGGMP